MYISLAEAARRTGLSKPTVQRAIKSGKLSAASTNPDGSYNIDPAELARVYNLDPNTGHVTPTMKQDEPPTISGGLQVEVAVLREKLSSVSIERDRERDQLNRQIEDLQRRLDAEAEARRLEAEERRKLTAILTDQRTKPNPAQPEPSALPPQAEPAQSPAAQTPMQQQAGLWSRLRATVARQ